MQSNNIFFEMLDIEKCKDLIADAKKVGDTCVILCLNYSINIASKYEDGEELQWDWDDFEEALGECMEVSDYNDLIVDLSDGE